jgi:hypothetical protein
MHAKNILDFFYVCTTFQFMYDFKLHFVLMYIFNENILKKVA